MCEVCEVCEISRFYRKLKPGLISLLDIGNPGSTPVNFAIKHFVSSGTTPPAKAEIKNVNFLRHQDLLHKFAR